MPLFRWQAFVNIHETVCIPVSPRRVIPTWAIFWHTLPLGMHEEVFAMVCNKNVHFIDDKSTHVHTQSNNPSFLYVKSSFASIYMYMWKELVTLNSKHPNIHTVITHVHTREHHAVVYKSRTQCLYCDSGSNSSHYGSNVWREVGVIMSQHQVSCPWCNLYTHTHEDCHCISLSLPPPPPPLSLSLSLSLSDGHLHS